MLCHIRKRLHGICKIRRILKGFWKLFKYLLFHLCNLCHGIFGNMILLKQPLHHPVWFAQHFRCCHDIYHTVWNIIPLQIGIYVFRCFCKLLILRKLLLPIAFFRFLFPNGFIHLPECLCQLFRRHILPLFFSQTGKFFRWNMFHHIAQTILLERSRDLLVNFRTFCCAVNSIKIIVHLIIQTTLFFWTHSTQKVSHRHVRSLIHQKSKCCPISFFHLCDQTVNADITAALFLRNLMILLQFPQIFAKPFLLLCSVLLLNLLCHLIQLLHIHIQWIFPTADHFQRYCRFHIRKRTLHLLIQCFYFHNIFRCNFGIVICQYPHCTAVCFTCIQLQIL